MNVPEQQYLRAVGLAQILTNLDRCQHGRHLKDNCFLCPGGQSAGNPYLTPGQIIGYGLHGEHIVVPEADRRYEPRAWTRERKSA